jgi:hypothetical protein
LSGGFGEAGAAARYAGTASARARLTQAPNVNRLMFVLQRIFLFRKFCAKFSGIVRET